MSEIKEKAAIPTEDNMLQRMTQVFKEAMQVELKAFRTELENERQKILKENNDELEKALRQSLGVEKDLPVTRSQLSEAIRKAMLEQADSQKRTPAPEMAKAGSDAPKADPFDLKLKEKGLEA